MLLLFLSFAILYYKSYAFLHVSRAAILLTIHSYTYDELIYLYVTNATLVCIKIVELRFVFDYHLNYKLH